MEACSLQVQRTVVTGVRAGTEVDGYDEVVAAAPVRFVADDVHS